MSNVTAFFLALKETEENERQRQRERREKEHFRQYLSLKLLSIKRIKDTQMR